MSNYLDYPRWIEYAKNAYEDVKNINCKSFKVKIEDKIIDYNIYNLNNVIISGMGGSGIVGDIIYDLCFDRCNVNIIVVKDFKIPKTYLTRNSLLISISYSGNTIETIQCTLQALKNGIPIIIVSTNGMLENIAKQYNIPFIKIQKATAPRYALPSLLYSTLAILKNYNIDISDDEINDGLCGIENAFRNLDFVKEIANKLQNKIPIIYIPQPLHSIGLRFKNDLNENSKKPAIVAILPESEHNDIATCMVRQEYILPILIWSIDIDYEYLKHVRSIKEVLKYYNKDFIEIELKMKTRLGNIMYAITLLGLVSLELAKLNNINPIDIKAIDLVKEFYKKIQ